MRGCIGGVLTAVSSFGLTPLPLVHLMSALVKMQLFLLAIKEGVDIADICVNDSQGKLPQIGFCLLMAICTPVIFQVSICTYSKNLCDEFNLFTTYAILVWDICVGSIGVRHYDSKSIWRGLGRFPHGSLSSADAWRNVFLCIRCRDSSETPYCPGYKVQVMVSLPDYLSIFYHFQCHFNMGSARTDWW